MFASGISSLTSLASYQEPIFQTKIAEIRKDTAPLQDLVKQAEKLVADFTLVEEHVFSYDKAEVNLDKLLNAMLLYADEAGGEESTRYVSAAVIACGATAEEGRGWAERLRDLGITWLTHLLYMFKEKASHKREYNENPDDIATPTIDNTVNNLQEGVGNRKDSFRYDLLLREGYECPVTGAQDSKHPSPRNPINAVKLEAAHILRRAIADFDSDHKSPSFKSAAATFDILVNFTRLPVEELQDLKNLIDHPSNGILLESNARVGFEGLRWCLQKTGEEDVYEVKVVSSSVAVGLILRQNMEAPVVFRDRSGEFTEGPTSARKRSLPISTPSSRFISLHAAIAGIMFMSGAGKFFDELLDKYGDEDGSIPLVHWIDLEAAVAAEETREMLVSSFRQTQLSGQ